MSGNKNLDTKENDENLLNTTRKRTKHGIVVGATKASHLPRKLARTETASSGIAASSSLLSSSLIPPELIAEMGIGMLESEESSSSAQSAIALGIISRDENSNESATNLDVLKCSYQTSSGLGYRSDSTTDSNNKDNLTMMNNVVEIIGEHNCSGSDGGNGIVGGTLEGNDNDEIVNLSRKKMSTTVMGSSSNNNNNIIVAASPSRNIRSPLATVTSNKLVRTTLSTLAPSTSTTNLQSPSSNTIYMQPMPSTSHQAMLIKQQQQQQHQQFMHQHHLLQHQRSNQLRDYQQQLQTTQQVTRIIPWDTFFLFRDQMSVTTGATFNQRNYFGTLSDEIILQIFKWLPKKALMRCSSVCQRFNRCAKDESLWSRLDLGARTLRAGSLEQIVTRGVIILRLAQSVLRHPVFSESFLMLEKDFSTKLQYLDLSMSSIQKQSLKMLLSHCRHLRKLSLEHVPVNDDVCTEIAANKSLEALNLTMCIGLEAWSVRKMLESLSKLNSLNISWAQLSVDAVTALVSNITPNLMRLNIAGCRKTLFDSHLGTLAKRCPNLLELDLSDCTALTSYATVIVCEFKMLEYLSLSRCYLIPLTALSDLSKLNTLAYLDVFGMLNESGMKTLEENCPDVGLNKFLHSSVARPTVGSRRTSIWGLRTRD